MKKIKEFMEKPVTWKGYFKLSLICMIIGLIYTFTYLSWMFDIPSKLRGKLNEFKKSLNSNIKSRNE